VGRIADSANHRWFGLTPIQFFGAVALRVIVAAIVGVVVYLATGSVLWLIVALFATSVVISSIANSRHRA
jgi:membrane protein YdbS with pleckstrin-like domain